MTDRSTFPFLRKAALHHGHTTFTNTVGIELRIVLNPRSNVGVDNKFVFQRMAQAIRVPLLIKAAWWNVLIYNTFNDFFADCRSGLFYLLRCHQLRSLVINDLALIIGNVIVLQQIFFEYRSCATRPFFAHVRSAV